MNLTVSLRLCPRACPAATVLEFSRAHWSHPGLQEAMDADLISELHSMESSLFLHPGCG